MHPSPVAVEEDEDAEASTTMQSTPNRLVSEDDARSILKEAAKVAGQDISLVSLACG
jgi:hypothetical protein